MSTCSVMHRKMTISYTWLAVDHFLQITLFCFRSLKFSLASFKNIIKKKKVEFSWAIISECEMLIVNNQKDKT